MFRGNNLCHIHKVSPENISFIKVFTKRANFFPENKVKAEIFQQLPYDSGWMFQLVFFLKTMLKRPWKIPEIRTNLFAMWCDKRTRFALAVFCLKLFVVPFLTLFIRITFGKTIIKFVSRKCQKWQWWPLGNGGLRVS